MANIKPESSKNYFFFLFPSFPPGCYFLCSLRMILGLFSVLSFFVGFSEFASIFLTTFSKNMQSEVSLIRLGVIPRRINIIADHGKIWNG